MNFIKAPLIVMLLSGLLFAQDPPAQERCYQDGNVDAFLATQQSAKRRSIVLYNFDDDSG